MIRVQFCSGSENFLKIRFMFGSSSLNIGVWFVSVQVFHDGKTSSGSSSMELETYFHGGQLLWINCISTS